MVFVQQVNCSNDLVGFAELGALLTVKRSLQVFHLAQLMQSCIILVGFETEEGNVSFDLASLCVNLTVVVFVDFLNHPQRVEGVLSQIRLVLELTEGHHNLSQVISVCILLQSTESIHGPYLVFYRLIKLLRFVEHFRHFQVCVS